MRDFSMLLILLISTTMFVCTANAAEKSKRPIAEILLEVLHTPPQPVYWFSDRANSGRLKLKNEPEIDPQKRLTGAPKDRMEFAGTVRVTDGKIVASRADFDTIMDNLSKLDNVIVYAHGCCISFDDSLKNAMDLSKAAGCPVVAVDWDSPPGSHNYLKNEEREALNEPKYSMMLRTITSKLNSAKTTFVGHSMGNRLIAAFLRDRFYHKQIDSKFRGIIFANADVDAQSFAQYADEIVPQADNIYIVANRHDKALAISSLIHGAKRIGKTANQMLSPKVNVVQYVPQLTSDLAKAFQQTHSLPIPLIASIARQGQVSSPLKQLGLK